MEEFNHFDELFQQYDDKINKLVRAAALKVERAAKMFAPVDTGFLRNSIYVVTENFSDDAASFKRLARQAKGIPDVFPKVEPPGHNEAIVAVGATYGVYVEYGTSLMAAHPFLTPALEAEGPVFQEALERLMNQASAAGVDLGLLGDMDTE